MDCHFQTSSAEQVFIADRELPIDHVIAGYLCSCGNHIQIPSADPLNVLVFCGLQFHHHAGGALKQEPTQPICVLCQMGDSSVSRRSEVVRIPVPARAGIVTSDRLSNGTRALMDARKSSREVL